MIILIFLFSSIPIIAVEAQQLVFYDNFNNYVEKSYSGRDGPGIWVQESIASATYSIAGGAYKIQSSGGVWTSKAILDFYRIFSRSWPPGYDGPKDYIFSVGIKIDSGGGGIIFRAMPGSQEKYWTHYEVRINKDNKKVTLANVIETSSEYAETVLKTVDFPSDVNINDWFRLSVRVQGSSIQVSIAGKKVIDVTSTLSPNGGVGLMVLPGGTASFDWAELDILTTTVTNTVTSTITSTVAEPPSTVTATVTVSELVTTTITTTIASTTTETVTQTAATVTETALPQTTTVTQTMTVSGPVSTQTVKETVTSISTVTLTQPTGGGIKCLIATAAFGSEIAPQVQALREFRDGLVMKTFAGENFMNVFNTFYYSWSPYVAQAEYENDLLRRFIRFSIYPLIWILDLSKLLAEPLFIVPEFAVLVSGLVASSLIGLVYVSPIVLLVILIMKQRGKRINLSLVYPFSALMVSLLFFFLAEITVSPIFMMVASSMVVLSSMATTSIAPIKILFLKKKPK
ncbi:MAG: CFI-box-CTERM domain-containing protein [Nitrososphaerota archaeon]